MALRYPYFKTAFGLITITLFIIFFSIRLWQSEPIIKWDITLYYSYLPATFIYHDLTFEDQAPEWEKHHFFRNTDKEGNRFIKMTCGLAYLYSPFFFIGHAYAYLWGEPANGFSPPYHCTILLSALIYGLLGLWFLGKVLLRFFHDKVVAATLILLFAGTNMPYYTLVEPMSHIYNFSLVSFILFLFFGYLDRPTLGKALLIGLAIGTLVLIRPTNIIILLAPLIYILRNRNLDNKKFWRHLPLIVLMALIPWLPQLYYWHMATGNWLVYTYNSERFFFTDPEIIKGLFSYRKGWLVYSPMMIFAFAGFFFLFRKDPKLTISILITMVLGIWVTFSWWCWWYGGGFGARPLIDFLPLMAFGFAAFLRAVFKSRWFISIPVMAILLFLGYLSGFTNYQYKRGIIHFDGMTRELYWKEFLVPYYIKDYDQYVDPPDYQAALRNEEE